MRTVLIIQINPSDSDLRVTTPTAREGAIVKIQVAALTATILCLVLGRIDAQWDQFSNDCPRFTIEASTALLTRAGDDNNIPLVSNELTLAPVFDSYQATSLGSTPSLELAAMFQTRSGHHWEIETTFARWDNSIGLFGPDLTTPFLPGLNPDTVNYNYDSELFSIEFNFRQKCMPGLTFLIGPRYISLEEHVDFSSQTLIVFPPPFDNLDFTTNNTIDTNNPLIGGQIGLEWDFLLTRDLFVSSFIKVGGFANNARATLTSETTIQDLLEERRTKNTGSFVGELGGRLNFNILGPAFTGFVGYQAMWIDGVALAPTQFINVNSNGALFVENTPSFHGAVFGIQANY